MVTAMGLFATMDTVIKGLRDDYGAVQILFFRLLFGGLPLIVFLSRSVRIADFSSPRWPAHALRTLIVVAGMGCFFHAFATLPLADVYAVSYAGPLVATALSVPLLGEKVGARRFSAIFVGLLGVMVVLRPAGDVFGTSGLIALVGTVLFSINLVMLRAVSRTDNNRTILVQFTFFGVLFTGLAAPFDWVWPPWPDALRLALVGLIGGVGQIFFTLSASLAPVGVVAPYQYTSLLWGLVYGLLLFGNQPDGLTLAGAAIVMGSGVYVLYRERRIASQGR